LDGHKVEDPLTFHRFGYHTQWTPLNGITLGIYISLNDCKVKLLLK
jgi:hypothetical protein